MLTPHGRRAHSPYTHHVGATIAGKYRIKRLLGHGGMGAVYKAENMAIGRTVAVKVLHPHLADDGVTLARFQREARAAAAVGHRHVVDVLDMGVEPSGAPFLVMEYVRGKSVAKLLQSEGHIEVERACGIAGQVLSGLAAVHERGIIHRDLKPENVLLTVADGRSDFVKIFDFGIATFVEGAREASSGQDLTPSGRTMGTPYYASPEQLKGGSGRDQRVDLYAVGVMLFEMVCGQRPFQADNFVDLCQMILHHDLPPMAVFRRGVPADFEAVVKRALCKDPDQRFTSARDMVEALVSFGAEPIVDDEPEPTDTFTVDLRELRERELELIQRPDVQLPDSERPASYASVSGDFLMPVRSYLRARLGERGMAEIVAALPPEVHARFVGVMSPGSWYPSSLLRVLERADEHYGNGDRKLIADAGRHLARTVMAEGGLGDKRTPELVYASVASYWGKFFGSGKARVAKVGHGYGLLEVADQLDPTLARSVAFVGFLDECLRSSGARDVDVRLSKAAALGDPIDLFESSWAS